MSEIDELTKGFLELSRRERPIKEWRREICVHSLPRHFLRHGKNCHWLSKIGRSLGKLLY